MTFCMECKIKRLDKLIKSMKKIKDRTGRHIILLLIITIFFIIKMSPTVSAAELIDFSFPLVDFTMEIGADGDVHITERWKISFPDYQGNKS